MLCVGMCIAVVVTIAGEQTLVALLSPVHRPSKRGKVKLECVYYKQLNYVLTQFYCSVTRVLSAHELNASYIELARKVFKHVV